MDQESCQGPVWCPTPPTRRVGLGWGSRKGIDGVLGVVGRRLFARYGACMTWPLVKRFECAVLIFAAFTVSGCSTPGPSTAARSSSVVTTAGTSAPPSLPATSSPSTPRPSGGITVNPAGAVLPDSARTPGAINPSVTQANIGQTICVSGWTATVRPPASLTTRLKVVQLASGYTYKGDTATGDYEEDHLISLELGGAPSAEANLWLEPYNAPEGARVKDQVENKLHALVCAGTITLATAQQAIATNWWNAYQTYVRPTPAAPK
jgi:hypothetical protein